MKITNLKINKRAKAMFAATVMLLSQGCGRQIEEISRPTKPSKPSISQTQTETTTVELTTEQITEMVTKPKETEYEYPKYEEPEYEYPEYVEPQSPVEQSTQAPTQKQTDVTTEINEPTINETTNITEEEPTMNETTKATTKATTKPKQTTTTKTTTKVTTTKPKQTTTTKATTKATNTTKQTTKATTTTTKATTTTTPAPTEPNYYYKLEDITNNYYAFDLYAQIFNKDLMKGNRMQTVYSGSTFGGRESDVALAMLNYGKISDEVLKEVFKDYTPEEIKNGTLFFYLIADTQDLFNTDVDFEKYTLDKNVGRYLNNIDDTYRNGSIDALLYDVLMNGNISQEYLYNPAVMSLLCSYDKNNTYIDSFGIDEHCVNAFIDDLCETVFGKSYTR